MEEVLKNAGLGRFCEVFEGTNCAWYQQE